MNSSLLAIPDFFCVKKNVASHDILIIHSLNWDHDFPPRTLRRVGRVRMQEHSLKTHYFSFWRVINDRCCIWVNCNPVTTQLGDLLFPTSSLDSRKLFFRHSMTSGKVSLPYIQPYHGHRNRVGVVEELYLQLFSHLSQPWNPPVSRIREARLAHG